MANMTKEELKEELAKFKKKIDVFEDVRRELVKENPKVADILNLAAQNDVISAIIAARLISIISSFFKVDPGEIKINKS